jgi:hypothetical protein
MAEHHEARVFSPRERGEVMGAEVEHEEKVLGQRGERSNIGLSFPPLVTCHWSLVLRLRTADLGRRTVFLATIHQPLSLEPQTPDLGLPFLTFI